MAGASLKRTWFHILLALADESQHGFAIRKSVEQRTDVPAEVEVAHACATGLVPLPHEVDGRARSVLPPKHRIADERLDVEIAIREGVVGHAVAVEVDVLAPVDLADVRRATDLAFARVRRFTGFLACAFAAAASARFR